LSSFAKGLDLKEDFFKKHFERPSSLLRFLKYPPAKSGKIGIGEHSDYGCLTLIDQDMVGGL
jgi:isopenicillin N synthase-like dioxygenase